MRTLGRYGFILLGLPNIIGFAVATILGGMLVPVVPEGKRPTLLCVAEMLSGLVSFFATILIARLVRIEPSFWIFALPGVWFFVYFVSKNRVLEFFRSASGILCGWLLCRFVATGG